jgi:hypothetical protein
VVRTLEEQASYVTYQRNGLNCFRSNAQSEVGTETKRRISSYNTLSIYAQYSPFVVLTAFRLDRPACKQIKT